MLKKEANLDHECLICSQRHQQARVSAIKISLRGVQSKLGTILNHYRHKFDNRILAIKKNGIHQNVLAACVEIKLYKMCILVLKECLLFSDLASVSIKKV